MKQLKSAVYGLLLLGLLSALNVQADGVDTIKSKGVLTVGVVIDPPFGVKNKDGSISGYDVDFAFAIARKLGVKPVVLELDADERIPALNSHKIDILTATTKTVEREKLVNFSYGYFVTGQKFVAKVGKIKVMNDAKALSIGAIRGTTAEKTIKQELPGTPIIGFADIDEAFQALQQGKIDAVTYDEGMLANKLNKMPNKQLYEISPISVAVKAYGIAVFKGEKRLLDMINDTLSEMERTGEADRIFNRWFGPTSPTPLSRIFRIQS
ncbi:transporter substrate-binding domain-containing protein [Chitinimonas sp. BJB300]|uniref:transporter substrate-binding domain-containing protein n=1 Tax=Chitinimonas sp. BJB300 TaxID=1559339 RepID=UPI000C11F4E3|nr:transporter substrate-binding domain-containing protein [Chitinimonas sp. BJB300]PHV10882.1 amino acid ABC transporter substrate-binding protein [Chitinimonas sp. BJB300]TSJ91304.1 transporter substrate-binding domain-containing protein [Chitinimonas sp. BJB300]